MKSEDELRVRLLLQSTQFQIFKRVVLFRCRGHFFRFTRGIDCSFGELQWYEVFDNAWALRLHLQNYYLTLIHTIMNDSSSGIDYSSSSPAPSSNTSSRSEQQRRIQQQTIFLEKQLISFYQRGDFQQIVVNKNYVSVELNKQRQDLLRQIGEQEAMQRQIAGQIEREKIKIEDLSASIAAKKNIHQIVKDSAEAEGIKQNRKQLTQLMDRCAGQEGDTSIKMETTKLREQLEAKKKNQGAMVQVLKRQIGLQEMKINEFRKKSEEYRLKTSELQKGRDEEQMRQMLDETLCQDRTKLLVQAIGKLKKKIQYQRN